MPNLEHDDIRHELTGTQALTRFVAATPVPFEEEPSATTRTADRPSPKGICRSFLLREPTVSDKGLIESSPSISEHHLDQARDSPEEAV